MSHPSDKGHACYELPLLLALSLSCIQHKTEAKESFKSSCSSTFLLYTDSREFKLRDCSFLRGFCCLKGEKFNAFDYHLQILNNGCDLFIYGIEELEKIYSLASQFPQTTFLGVSDTTLFCQELAQAYLSQWRSADEQRKVIALTGSNGKTTNKEMIYHLLNGCFPEKVHMTFKNFNNHLGVPFTIYGLKNDHQYLILEMGSNHPGEIQRLCEIATPDMGYITNIGAAHLEFFHDLKGVLAEKRALFDSILKQPHGIFLLNGDDQQLATLVDLKDSKIVTTSQEGFSHRPVLSLPSSCEISKGQEKILLKNPFLIGIHNYKNLSMAFILVDLILTSGHQTSTGDFNLQKLIELACNFTPKDNRSMLIEKKGVSVFLDAYNANPSSMEMSFMAFSQYVEESGAALAQALYILGDMNELGSLAPMAHEELGRKLARRGVLHPHFVGKYAKDYQRGYQSETRAISAKEEESFVFENVQQISFDQFLSTFSPRFVFLKGSRSLQLESLLGIN